MTTTNDGGPDTTNAGPVLPEAPELRVKLADTIHMTWRQARECDQNIRADIEAYGLQCWNACDEQVAGPLRERVAELERENGGLRQQHDRDSKELRALCDQRDEYIVRSRQLQADKRALLHGGEEQRSEIARLRAEVEAKDARIAEVERSHSEFLDARRAWLASDAIKQSAVDRLRAENEALASCLRECSDDLESEVEARRGGDVPRRIERDLEPVRKARKLLAARAARGAA